MLSVKYAIRLLLSWKTNIKLIPWSSKYFMIKKSIHHFLGRSSLLHLLPLKGEVQPFFFFFNLLGCFHVLFFLVQIRSVIEPIITGYKFWLINTWFIKSHSLSLGIFWTRFYCPQGHAFRSSWDLGIPGMILCVRERFDKIYT